MTNPNNAVGTNGAFGGRTSVNAFNDVLALVSKGVVSGWACSPSSGMTVQLGGVAGTRDVAVAEDNAGNKTTVNNISGSPIEVTIANASTTDNMIDYIVAYVSNPPSGDEDVADNPSACGIISVRGASANTAPTASAIRSAITADGGTGTLAYYVVLAQISVTAGLTTITNDNISAVDVSGVGSNNIDFTTFDTVDLNFGHLVVRRIPMGYGLSANLFRLGNLVVCAASSVTSRSLPSGEIPLGETIPSGFRPITSEQSDWPMCITGLSGSNAGWATWTVSKAGGMTFNSSGLAFEGGKRINIFGAWITQDNWPA